MSRSSSHSENRCSRSARRKELGQLARLLRRTGRRGLRDELFKLLVRQPSHFADEIAVIDRRRELSQSTHSLVGVVKHLIRIY